MRRIAFALLACIVGTALGACGGNDKADDAISTTGACRLLSRDDITKIGYKVKSGPKLDDTTAADDCVFLLTQTIGSILRGQISVTTFPADQARSITKAQFPDAVPVPGIGVEAWTSRTHVIAAARLADGRLVTVKFTYVGPDDFSAAMTALLTLAVGRV